jgi:hypothetical protein
MVSSTEATTSAVGSLTYGSHHLSADDSGHLRPNAAPTNGGRPSAHREVLAPVVATGERTGPSRDADTAPVAYDVLYVPPPPPRCGRRRRTSHGHGGPAHGATVASAVDGLPHPDRAASGSSPPPPGW